MTPAAAADRLDSVPQLEAADPSGMLRHVASAAAQIRRALRATEEADLSPVVTAGRPRAIVACGMGGSFRSTVTYPVSVCVRRLAVWTQYDRE